jgi:hypothetical protein
MLYEKDLKLFAYLQCAYSESISENDKKILADWIEVSSAEEIMNLLMTGKTDSINEKHEIVAEKFSISPVGLLIEELNREVDNIIFLGEGFWPSPAEWDAIVLAVKYSMTPVGQAHLKVSSAIGNKIIDLFNVGQWNIGPVSIAKPTLDAIRSRTAIHMGAAAGVGGIAVGSAIALISYIGYKVYKRMFDKFEKKCRAEGAGKGTARKACLAHAKVNAYEAQIKAMEAKKAVCSKAKDADKCKAKIDKKLNKMKKNLQGAQEQLRKAVSKAKGAASKVKQYQKK